MGPTFDYLSPPVCRIWRYMGLSCTDTARRNREGNGGWKLEALQDELIFRPLMSAECKSAVALLRDSRDHMAQTAYVRGV